MVSELLCSVDRVHLTVYYRPVQTNYLMLSGIPQVLHSNYNDAIILLCDWLLYTCLVGQWRQ